MERQVFLEDYREFGEVSAVSRKENILMGMKVSSVVLRTMADGVGSVHRSPLMMSFVYNDMVIKKEPAVAKAMAGGGGPSWA